MELFKGQFLVSETEFYQLPAPIFEQTEEHTRTVLFAHRKFMEANAILPYDSQASRKFMKYVLLWAK